MFPIWLRPQRLGEMSLFDKLTANKYDKATDVSHDEIDGDVSCTTCSNNVINLQFFVLIFY